MSQPPLMVLLSILIPTSLHATPSAKPTSKPTTTQPAREAKWIPARPGPWNQTLKAARSTDGLKFKPDPKFTLQYADAPTLTRFDDGRLLLVFEHYPRTDRKQFGRLGYTLSRDDGKTWNKPTPLAIKGLPRRHGPPRGPALMKTPDKHLDLYFTCNDRKDRQTLFAARLIDPVTFENKDKTKNSIAFEIHTRPRLDDRKTRLQDITLLDINGRTHLYANLRGDGLKRYHATITKSSRIRKEDPLSFERIGSAGTIIEVDGIYRFYASGPAGILSALSANGEDWNPEPGVRLTGARDPAVTRLKGSGFLMVYVEQSRSTIRKDRLSTEGETQTARADEPDDDFTSAEWDMLSADTVDPLDGLLEGNTQSDPSTRVDLGDDPMNEDADSEMGEANGNFDDGPEDVGYYEPEYCIGDVPVPDFKHPIDYRAWFEGLYEADAPIENAFDYYNAIIPNPFDRSAERPEWPNFRGLFNDAGDTGPPAPWDPIEHPEWDEAASATADLLGRYSEAAAIEEYVPRIMFASDIGENGLTDEDGRNLLINIMLPSLSSHRALAKQILGDAWRAPEGHPDPQAMLNAIDTTLGSANHLADGDFLIERLVSVAIKNLTYHNARWALKHDVFSADEMEATLETMIDRDRPPTPASEWISGELAASLDMTQYVYGPIQPNREPTLNPERFALINSYTSDEAKNRAATPEQIAAADPWKTTNTFIEYYDAYAEMADRGYPEVTAEDLNQLTNDYIKEDPVARGFLPSLSRVYQLFNRQEASRRATQLTYAIHLHHARTGHWPATLDDLPPRYTDTARTDPFTKDDFVYRLTKDGPLLYSSSENGTDDGGTHHRRWGDNKEEEEDDYVFWPPQRR
ncbi:MAG: sialidase family protein [Phycisphaerae bacterium]